MSEVSSISISLRKIKCSLIFNDCKTFDSLFTLCWSRLHFHYLLPAIFTPAYIYNTPHSLSSLRYCGYVPAPYHRLFHHLYSRPLLLSIITSCTSMTLKHVQVLAWKKSLKQTPSSSYFYVCHKLLIMRVMYTSCFYVFTHHSFHTPTPSGLCFHNSSKRLLAIIRIAVLTAHTKLPPSVLFLLDQSLLVDYTSFLHFPNNIYFFSFPSTPYTGHFPLQFISSTNITEYPCMSSIACWAC